MTWPGRIVIADEEALAEFRRGLSSSFAMDLLRQAGGRLLIQLAVGVGKTRWLIDIVTHMLMASTEYELVIVLSPRWDVLNEILSCLPPDLNSTVLRPRPKDDCGELNAQWERYERTGCGILGREELCGICPRRRTCHWPDQYGMQLRDTHLILTTQQHVVLDPGFILKLKNITRAVRAIVLVDESDLLLKSVEHTIGSEDLRRFIATIERATDAADGGGGQWLGLTGLLANALTDDLQDGDWSFPWVSPDWARDVQRIGLEIFGDQFRFLGFDLNQFAQSDRGSRERSAHGGLRYSVRPSLGDSFIIFSGSIASELARYRLDPDHRDGTVVSPFENHVFEHPDTRWYNIGSVAGAAKNFRSNASVILDFFAAKLADNIHNDKRTLLIVRKKFVQLCKQQLEEKLQRLGIDQFNIITANWDHANLDEPRMVPLVSYGIVGVNSFEDYDAAYCLSGYYVNQHTLAKAVHDLDATADRFPISICKTGNPPRRRAHVELPDNRVTILPMIAQGTLGELEANVVVQAVGRVRPFTRPREIITFHAGDLPGVDFDMDFRSLAAARSFFGIPTQRVAEHESRVARARLLREQGLTRGQIAHQMGVNIRTVRRYLQQDNRTRNL